MQDSSIIEAITSQSHFLDGKKVDCKRAVPKETHQQVQVDPYFKTKKMFIGGLPPDVTGDVFRGFFEQFGPVEDSVVILDKETGRPRGFGFVTFQDEDTADKVLANYEKNCINGKWVECKKATPKSGSTVQFQPHNLYNPHGFSYPFFQSAFTSWYPDYSFNEG
jgi:RNA recognition motif-containing protein